MLGCLVVIVSFAMFVVDQTRTASAHQQAQLDPTSGSASGGLPASNAPTHKGGVRRAIDNVDNALTSPFHGLTNGFGNQWAVQGAQLLLALLVYGFALGYAARLIRVRV